MENTNKNDLTILEKKDFDLQDEKLNSMNEKDFADWQNQLWVLLSERTNRYTTDDSSSVPVEIAQELFKSICYCITLCKNNNKLSQAQSKNAKELFLQGLNEAENLVAISKVCFKKVKLSFLKIENDFYQDIIPEINRFFKKYDFVFFAHSIPTMINYPLCLLPQKKQGIEYINCYLSSLLIENDFCNKFNINTIKNLLKTYSTDYQTLPINIYELVINQAIALTLLKKDIFTLSVNETDSAALIKYLLSLTKKEARLQLISAVNKLCDQLNFKEDYDISASEYFANTAISLLEKIIATKKVANNQSATTLFYYINNVIIDKTPKTKYIDSMPMEDEKLRDLIDKISDCEALTEKVVLVKKSVHNLSDLTEILGICFWGDDSLAIFNTLDISELGILLKFINDKYTKHKNWESDSNWEKEFLKYIDIMDKQKQLEIKTIADSFTTD